MRRTVGGSSHDELTLGLPLHCRAVLWGVDHTLFSFVHRLSPSVSTSLCNSSKSAAQRWRYLSIHAASSSSARWPSLQVRTRPTFSVVTSPACSRTPTCFFMPVRQAARFCETGQMALEDELYKSLLEESKLYREKVST